MLCTLSVRTALITQERINESELSYAEMKSEYLKNDIKTLGWTRSKMGVAKRSANQVSIIFK